MDLPGIDDERRDETVPPEPARFTDSASQAYGSLLHDLVLLDDLSEKRIAARLTERYEFGQIYTYISGQVLISINPFKKLPVYERAYVDRYRGRYLHENPPHIFAVAEEAYRLLRLDHENQCVLITGESGAGKTEASKQIMGYLAAVSSEDSTGEIHRVKERMLSSNPVLEAFGNAKTVRNQNSSRFGKYMEIVFDGSFQAVGGRVTNYLLEKSRVVSPAAGERSFHAFYQLLRGADPATRAALHLDQGPAAFRYLAGGGCVDVEGVDDAAAFAETLAGLRSVGLDEGAVRDVMRTLASVLWLGQIEFVPAPDRPDGSCTVEDAACVRAAADLLGLAEADLASALLARRFEVSLGSSNSGTLHRDSSSLSLGRARSTSVVPLDVGKARNARDALAKAIYSRLFDWLVARINAAIDPAARLSEIQARRSLSVGVLDIYGFEVFERNSLEQLFINYANERLQQIFIDVTIKNEQDEYESEGIDWEHVDFFNNAVVCELIEGKLGVLALLDEACLFPRSTDGTLLDRLDERYLRKHAHYVRPKQVSSAFTIRHYAGDVVYAADGFLEKNRDPLRRDLLELASSSSVSLWAELFPRGEADEVGSRRPVTVATQFKGQVASLTAALSACTGHYVRCIKPNDERRAGLIDEARLLHQVRYLGLLENVRVRRAGFTFRQDARVFLRRYKMLAARTWPVWDERNAVDGVRVILGEGFGVPEAKTGFQMGRTKVFVRDPLTMQRLEEARSVRLHDLATIISSNWRRFVVRKAYRRTIAARRIQSFARGRAVREHYRKTLAATCVQSFARGRSVRERYVRDRASTVLQQYARGRLRRVWYEREVAATELQRFVRGRLARRYYVELVASRRIQRAYRGYQGRMTYLKLRARALGLFDGRKLRRMVSVRRFHLGQYLDPDAERDARALLPAEAEVLFAAEVVKVNRSGSADARLLVLQSADVFLIDRVKGAVKWRLPVAHVVGAALSPLADNYFVLRTAEPSRGRKAARRNDVLLCSDYKTEFLTALSGLMSAPLVPEIALEISYVIKGSVGRVVRFVETDEIPGPVKGSTVKLEGAVAGADPSRRGSIVVQVGEIPVASAAFMRKLVSPARVH